MEVFETLRNRFVGATASTIRKIERNMAHIGVSSGASAQVFYFQDKRVVLDSETVLVGEEVWDVVADLGSSGPEDKHCEIGYTSSRYGISESRPVLIFGDGVNGKIPPINKQIRSSYVSAEFSITDYELCVLFMNSIHYVARDFGEEITLVTFSPNTPSLDIEFDNDEVIDYILIRARMEYELRLMDAEKGTYYKSQYIIIDGKQVAKSQSDSVRIVLEQYRDIVRRVVKEGQTVRFSTVADVFGSEEDV